MQLITGVGNAEMSHLQTCSVKLFRALHVFYTQKIRSDRGLVWWIEVTVKMSKTNSRGCEQIIEVIVNMQKNGGECQVGGRG